MATFPSALCLLTAQAVVTLREAWLGSKGGFRGQGGGAGSRPALSKPAGKGGAVLGLFWFFVLFHLSFSSSCHPPPTPALFAKLSLFENIAPIHHSMAGLSP